MLNEALSLELHKDIMLEHHLDHNIYPSQIALLHFAGEAIRLINEDKPCEHLVAIRQSDGVIGKLCNKDIPVTASELVEALKLEFFLDNDDDECLTDPDFWDCECETHYIHEKTIQPECGICKAIHTEQPDSQISELSGFYV